MAALARRLTQFAAVAAFMLLAACGSSSTPSAENSTRPSPSPTPIPEATAGPMDACKLITAEEASAAAKATLTNVSATAGMAGMCIYADTNTQTAVIIFAEAYPNKSAAQSVSAAQIVTALGDSVGTAKVVTGIGDNAVEYPLTTSGPQGEAIFVFKNNVMFMIAMAPSSDPTQVEGLARQAVARL